MPHPNVSRRALLASAGLAMLAEVASGQENPTRIEHLWQKIYCSHRDMCGGPYPFAGTPKDIASPGRAHRGLLTRQRCHARPTFAH